MRASIGAALVSLSVCMSACSGASPDNGDDDVEQSSRELADSQEASDPIDLKDPDREFIPGNPRGGSALKLGDSDVRFVPQGGGPQDNDHQFIIGAVASESGIACHDIVLPEDKLCDGVADCSDGSDEQDCPDDGT